MHGMSIYDFKEHIYPLGFTYPPFAALLLRPLAALQEPMAEHTWLVMSALLTLAFGALLHASRSGQCSRSASAVWRWR